MIKRCFDIVAATTAIIVLLPVLIAVALMVKLTSSGPALYKGSRTGRFGVPFRILKFRTMVVDAEQLGGPSTALNDRRLTPVGKSLRKYKLDELPELLNIIRGEMSVVGPRPQVKMYTDLYSEEEQAILSVRPGLTDYATIEFVHMDQVLGDDDVDEKYRTEIEPAKNKLRLKYVKERSLLVDLRIVARTIFRLLGLASNGDS
jgi:lipopolysaccharide/colanic/teichoic acid biosynthesis glycosyltransferase